MVAQFETRQGEALTRREQYRSLCGGSPAQNRAAEKLRHCERGSRDDAVREAYNPPGPRPQFKLGGP
jgi:hypothetical protein